MEKEQKEKLDLNCAETIVEENISNCELSSVCDMSGWREADD